MVVSAGGESYQRFFPGKVAAAKSVELTFQVPGLVVKLPVREGQKVARGQVIGQLRQSEFQARREAAQGQFDQARAVLDGLRLGERPEEQLRRETQLRAAEAKLANARTEFDRYARLLPNGAVSRSEYDLSQTAYRVAQEDQKAARQLVEKGTVARKEDIEAQEAQVRTLEGRLLEAKVELADSTLRAPYSGVIAQRLIDEGQPVTANRPVVKFQNVDEIDIVVDVPEAVMATGFRPSAVRQMVAEFSKAPGQRFPVRLKELAQEADPATQTFQVRFTMKAPARVIALPGMTATVAVTYRRPRTRGSARLRSDLGCHEAGYRPAGGVAYGCGRNRPVPRGPDRRGERRRVGNRRRTESRRPGGGSRRTVPARRDESARPGRRPGSNPTVNIGEFSVRRNRVIFASIVFVLLGGFVAYQRLGRLEDPEFTIKEALIVTPYPGASAEEVAQEVTNPIEIACQQLGQLKRVESESTRGRSVVSAVIQDRYDKDKIPQVWDELRRKIDDIQFRLPPPVRGKSLVVDDFGDVYGIFLAITGEGYSQPELRRYTEFLRRELLLVRDVKKVDLFGEQQEQAFLEISRQRLTGLGISEEQIYRQLEARNLASDGGRVRVGDERLTLDSTGGFHSAEDMLGLVIGSDRTGRQLFLKDIATIERGYEDPPTRLLRYDGRPAVGLGISTVQGGNVVKMGDAVRHKLNELKRDQPVGIEIGEINFQPKAVIQATNSFMFNLGKAVTIVFVVLLIAMGRKAGFMIGFVLFLTIMGTFLVMYVDGNLLMERISLGALIIALCMLTDNAIVVTESLKVRIEAGEDKLHVIRDVIAQNQWPLFGATGIAVVAFAAIGLSEDRTGEYCNSLFWVIFISLALSWVAAITVTPLLGYLLFKPRTGGEAEESAHGGLLFRSYRSLLVAALRFRWAVLLATIGLFAIALYGFTGWIRASFRRRPVRNSWWTLFCRPAPTSANRRRSRAGWSDSFRLSRALHT